MHMKWKADWKQAKQDFIKWWDRKGLALNVNAPLKRPRVQLPTPVPPPTLFERWTSPKARVDQAEYSLAGRMFGGVAYPVFEPMIGPGSLNLILGTEPGFSEETVWYQPCITDPDKDESIRFTRPNRWLDIHMAIIEEGLRRSNGRWVVALPDLIEHVDTLSAMRGGEALLMDLIERPDWVQKRLAELNEAFFAVFDIMFDKIKFDGGNAYSFFQVWGPGKTCKLQCDFSCMISPEMFGRFVTPYLTDQCDWLDYSIYHLDGTTALQHLDALLSIDSLDAIEWTPQAGLPDGGSPQWYDLYRQIKRAGKCVQALGVKPDEVVPLIDAVGPEALYVMCSAPDEDSAVKLLQKTEQYRK
jgi:hypothetical protein